MTKHEGSGSIASRIRIAFLTCFSANDVDNNNNDDDDNDNGERMNEDEERKMDIERGGVIAPSGIILQEQHVQVLPINYRSRLLLTTDATVEQSEAAARSSSQGAAAKDEPCVVHTSVHYTNCLVPKLDLIVGSSYYWGVMDRYEAEELLNNKPEGTFLLRDSAQSEYLFSVSFRRYKRTLHARIEQKNHRFSFDFSDPSIFSADTITALIAYYKDPSKCLFFEPQLSVPLPRNFVFPLQHICRARIASLTTYDGVEKLNLPVLLKSFVKEYHYKHPVRTVNYIPDTDLLHVIIHCNSCSNSSNQCTTCRNVT